MISEDNIIKKITNLFGIRKKKIKQLETKKLGVL